jgi:GTP-sensing pleiotropic transcriptional regulator CodY
MASPLILEKLTPAANCNCNVVVKGPRRSLIGPSKRSKQEDEKLSNCLQTITTHSPPNIYADLTVQNHKKYESNIDSHFSVTGNKLTQMCKHTDFNFTKPQ